MNIETFIASVPGPKNIRENKKNQDATLNRTWKKEWLVVVCDGMGSKPYASIGSHLACQAVYNTVRTSSFDIPEKELVKKVYQSWLSYIQKLSPKIKAKDAATTCLFAWGDYSGKTRLLQLGDGAIFYKNDTFDSIHKKSDEMFSNETTALGYSTLWSDWQYKELYLKAGSTIILMSDGISDDLGNPEEFMNFIQVKFSKISPHQGKKYLINELNHWQTPHHSDDKSIGIIIWNKK